jgi:DNA processing protein
VGVAGTGLDVVYPPESRDVWSAVGARGLLLSEAPLGYGGGRWRFPERNRIMAALADVVVVVESPARGGSLITVDHAIKRSVPVMAVPGPITSPASAGSNRLLADGCGVVCDPDDVLLELGVRPLPRRARRTGPEPGRPEPSGQEDRRVLAAVDDTPTPFDRVLARTAMDALDLAAVLYRLEAEGWARSTAAGWERRPR